MRLPVLMLCYNNLALTQQAVESALGIDAEDIGVIVVNNGSTDGTREWLDEKIRQDSRVIVEHHEKNQSPAKLVNIWNRRIFTEFGATKFLGVPNDCFVPKNIVSELDRFPHGLVGAAMDWDGGWPEMTVPPPNDQKATALHSDVHVSTVLVRKWCWEAVAERYGDWLDFRYWMYACDCDLKLRLASCGISGIQTDLKCWHYGSATWRTAPEAERDAMLAQADRDRETFASIWGFTVGSPEHIRATEELLRGQR